MLTTMWEINILSAQPQETSAKMPGQVHSSGCCEFKSKCRALHEGDKFSTVPSPLCMYSVHTVCMNKHIGRMFSIESLLVVYGPQHSLGWPVKHQRLTKSLSKKGES